MHSEVLSWSSPLVLLNPLVFWYVAPVYAVHYIVFGDLILRYGRRGFWVLYAFGCLTGMYEFTITKVYWSVPWDPNAAKVLGVAWVSLLMVGFVWHAFMSFMMPFRLLSDYVFPGRAKPGTARDVRWLMVLIPVMIGAMGLVVLGNVLFLLGAVLGSLVVVTLTVRLFVRSAAAAGVTRLEDLVLSPKARRLGMAFFAAVYIAYGAVVKPELWGTGVALVIPVAFYAFLIACAYALLAAASPGPAVVGEPYEPKAPTFDAWRRFAVRYGVNFTVAFIGLAVAQAFAAPLVLALALLLFVGGFLPPLYLVPRLGFEAWTAWRSARVKSPAPEPAPPS